MPLNDRSSLSQSSIDSILIPGVLIPPCQEFNSLKYPRTSNEFWLKYRQRTQIKASSRNLKPKRLLRLTMVSEANFSTGVIKLTPYPMRKHSALLNASPSKAKSPMPYSISNSKCWGHIHSGPGNLPGPLLLIYKAVSFRINSLYNSRLCIERTALCSVSILLHYWAHSLSRIRKSFT